MIKKMNYFFFIFGTPLDCLRSNILCTFFQMMCLVVALKVKLKVPIVQTIPENDREKTQNAVIIIMEKIV